MKMFTEQMADHITKVLTSEMVIAGIESNRFGINEYHNEITALKSRIELGEFEDVKTAFQLAERIGIWKSELKAKYKQQNVVTN